jgi:hypothetical protein
MPSLPTYNKKLKNPKIVANALNNLFLNVTENSNLYQVGKDAMLSLK